MSNGTHIVVISLIGGEKLKQEYKTLSDAQRQLNLLLKELNEPGIWFLKINREIINIDRIHRINIVPQIMIEKLEESITGN